MACRDSAVLSAHEASMHKRLKKDTVSLALALVMKFLALALDSELILVS